MDDSGQPLPCPEEDAVIPRVPVGLGRHKPCLWVPPPRSGAPKREREEHETSEDEDRNDPVPKRHPSAVGKGGQDMDDPAPARRPSAAEYGGQFGTATRPQLNFRYPLSKVAERPLRSYPSAIALYGM